MIRSITLTNFKAFESMTLHLKGDAFLVGPNNAGKSTVIAALRAGADMIRFAHRRIPDLLVVDRERDRRAHTLSAGRYRLVIENLRHEFRQQPVRIALRFESGAQLHAVWPPDASPEGPFFYLTADDESVRTTTEAKRLFPRIGVVPILHPIDHIERIREEPHIKESLDTRLASRHFRNQLALLASEASENHANKLVEFKEWTEPWLREMTLRDVVRNHDGPHTSLDFFYSEPGRPTPKEIFWAGDGFQIWVQILLHMYRLRNESVVILDEPDVFLHPDLQRRVVDLLESVPAQVITATHSAEMISEAPPECVVWVDKSRRRGVRAPDAAKLLELSKSLGTTFNVALAKALRAKLVVFVEGDDMKILRKIASLVGATRIATEAGVAVIELKGFDRWDRVEHFEWFAKTFLQGSVEVFVLLDRDWRPETACAEIKRKLASVGVSAHIWSRKELESYLLNPTSLARVTGASEEWLSDHIRKRSAELRPYIRKNFVRRRVDSAVADLRLQAESDAQAEFRALWALEDNRADLVPPKRLLTLLNTDLQSSALRTTSFRTIAQRMRKEEVAHEMSNLLERLEDHAADR